jgi:hypothetical protein
LLVHQLLPAVGRQLRLMFDSWLLLELLIYSLLLL